MKKKLSVITCDKKASDYHTRQIQYLFEDKIIAEGYSVSDVREKEHLATNLCCITTDALEQLPDLRRKLLPDTEIVTFFATFTQDMIDKLNHLAVGTTALFVNMSEKMA